MTAALQHQHILPLFDFGMIDSTVYDVMPFVDGESLRARPERVHQLPVAEALAIARAVGWHFLAPDGSPGGVAPAVSVRALRHALIGLD